MQKTLLHCCDCVSVCRLNDQPSRTEWKTPPRRDSRPHKNQPCTTRHPPERQKLRHMKNQRHQSVECVESVRDKQTSRRVYSGDKRPMVPFSKKASGTRSPKRDKELLDRTGPGSNKCRKGPRSSDMFQKVLVKLPCRTRVDESARNDGKAGDPRVTDQQKAVGCEIAVEEKRPQKPKRPAENLTIGTLFDLASHLDAARKNTRRDFDPDSVMVIRQSDEGSRLLHMRPEFNEIVTLTSLSHATHKYVDLDASPLSLCHTDRDCAVRLGTLIAETVEHHVDVKKLEQTARSVSHRLKHGTAKTSEREVVCRRQPILVSTVRRPASNVGEQVQQRNTSTSCTPKVSSDQPASQAVVHHQNESCSLNSAQPCLTSVSRGFGNGWRTLDVGSDRHSDAAGSSSVCQPVISSTDGPPTGGVDVMQSVRRIIIGRNANTQSHLQLENLSQEGDSKLLKTDDQ